jgi:hypothetical protein
MGSFSAKRPHEITYTIAVVVATTEATGATGALVKLVYAYHEQ